MKKKYTLTLDNEFIKYCELNNITDIEKTAKETFNKGFAILKYGETPKISGKPIPPPTKMLYEGEDPRKKENLIKKTQEKWDKLGILDGLKPMEESSPIIEMIKPNPIQKIENKNDDLYGE